MQTDYTFGAFRYFIVASEQISFFDTIESKRKEAIKSFFNVLLTDKKIMFEINKRKYLLVFNKQISDSIYICKFSMESKKTIHKVSESDIENIAEVDYPFIYVIIDIKSQIVFIELKTSVFPDLNTSKKKLENCFKKSFDSHGFEVMFEEITDSNTFWSFVDQSNGVYSVSLIMNSPNLFGGFSNTNEMLKSIQGDYNNSRTTIKLSNKKPNLENINKENTRLNDAIEYIAAGGGEWELTVQPEKHKKRTYRSKNNIKKILFYNIESKEKIKELKASIIDAFKNVETILKEKYKNNENKKEN